VSKEKFGKKKKKKKNYARDSFPRVPNEPMAVPEPSRVLASALRGVRYTLIVRAVSFLANVLIVRRVATGTYAVASLQLETLLVAALLVAREGTRRAALRVADLQVAAGGGAGEGKAAGLGARGGKAAGKLDVGVQGQREKRRDGQRREQGREGQRGQVGREEETAGGDASMETVLGLGWATFFATCVLCALVGAVYAAVAGAEARGMPGFTAAVWLTMASCVAEALAEPLFLAAQHELRPEARGVAEVCAVLVRATATYVSEREERKKIVYLFYIKKKARPSSSMTFLQQC
jgi:hypothetical protein